MALIVITVQDSDNGVQVSVLAEPAPPRVVSHVPPTPAQQVAGAMLNTAQATVQQPTAPRGIIVPH